MYVSEDSDQEKTSGQQLQSSMFSLSGTGFFGAVGRSIDLGKIFIYKKKKKRTLYYYKINLLTCVLSML